MREMLTVNDSQNVKKMLIPKALLLVLGGEAVYRCDLAHFSNGFSPCSAVRPALSRYLRALN
jgi:hypothetical protein